MHVSRSITKQNPPWTDQQIQETNDINILTQQGHGQLPSLIAKAHSYTVTWKAGTSPAVILQGPNRIYCNASN